MSPRPLWIQSCRFSYDFCKHVYLCEPANPQTCWAGPAGPLRRDSQGAPFWLIFPTGTPQGSPRTPRTPRGPLFGQLFLMGPHRNPPGPPGTPRGPLFGQFFLQGPHRDPPGSQGPPGNPFLVSFSYRDPTGTTQDSRVPHRDPPGQLTPIAVRELSDGRAALNPVMSGLLNPVSSFV